MLPPTQMRDIPERPDADCRTGLQYVKDGDHDCSNRQVDKMADERRIHVTKSSHLLTLVRMEQN